VFFVILLALLAVPVAELYVIVEVADRIGIPETIFLLVAMSVAGAWLVRREGLGILARVDERLRAGELPAGDLLDGLFVLVAGALMLTPGFLTDALGLVLLVPFTRRPLRGLVQRRFRQRIERYRFDAPGGGRTRVWVTNVTDVTDVTDVTGGTGGIGGNGGSSRPTTPGPASTPRELGR
jgi:UPF0716 protein FxsA